MAGPKAGPMAGWQSGALGGRWAGTARAPDGHRSALVASLRQPRGEASEPSRAQRAALSPEGGPKPRGRP